MATIADRLAYYQARLAVQYRTQPKAKATIAILGKQVMGDNLVEEILRAFNVDNATGAQLDVIGKYVGMPRNVGLPVEQPYYGYWDAEQASDVLQNWNGLQDSEDIAVNPQSVFYQSTFVGTRNTDLSDAGYRFMIKMKIILNANNGTLASIMALLQLIMPGDIVLVDNKDMTLTYELSHAAPVHPEVLRPYLPRPMGVEVEFIVLTVVASPASITQTFHVSSGLVTSAACEAVVAEGSPPYLYQWIRLRDENLGAGILATTPNAASTTFTYTFSGLGTAVSEWKCIVTDANGFVAETATVTVTLTIDGPP